METYPADEQEVRYYAGVLRHAIRAAGFSVSEIERQLGAGPKALRRVFGGQVDLKFKHVVAVLRVIGMPQEEFFAIAASRRRKRRSPGGELLAMMHLGQRTDTPPLAEIEPPPPGHAGAPLSDNAFDDLVEEAVNRVMERRARQGGSAAQKAPQDAPESEADAETDDEELDDDLAGSGGPGGYRTGAESAAPHGPTSDGVGSIGGAGGAAAPDQAGDRRRRPKKGPATPEETVAGKRGSQVDEAGPDHLGATSQDQADRPSQGTDDDAERARRR